MPNCGWTVPPVLSTWFEAQFLPILNQRIKPTPKANCENRYCSEFALRGHYSLGVQNTGDRGTSTLAIMVGSVG